MYLKTSQTVKGTRKTHQSFTNLLGDHKILHRQFLCLCKYCLELNFDNYVYVIGVFQIRRHRRRKNE